MTQKSHHHSLLFSSPLVGMGGERKDSERERDIHRDMEREREKESEGGKEYESCGLD